MAILPNSLRVVLVLGLVFSRPSEGIRSESDTASQWWDAGEFRKFHARADEMHRIGDFAALEHLYRRAERYAHDIGHQQARISYLTALGNTYSILFRYREAIEIYGEATSLAEESGNWEAAGAIAPGLASVYTLVGDDAAARQASQDGLRYISRLPRPPYYEAALKLQYARSERDSADSGAALEAIEAVRRQPLVIDSDAHRVLTRFEMEAEAWSLLGEQRLRGGDLEAAEAALAEGLRLRRLNAPLMLYSSYFLLGSLRLAQAERASAPRDDLLREAGRFTALALELAGQTGQNRGAFRALRQQGVIRRKLGMPLKALEDFAAAADMANRWRLAVPTADSSLTGANVLLDQEVFRDYAEAAAAHALATGEERWVRESFLAAEQNRAISLRQTRALAPVWRQRLPDRYWSTLAQIRDQEGAHLVHGRLASRSEPLHLELTAMEAAAGFSGVNLEESFQNLDALNLLQQGLGKSELLLSIQVGEGQSYLWAVTQSSLHIYKLRGGDELGGEVARFRKSIVEKGPETNQLAARLYESLFGQLNALESAKAAWLLSLDGPLFELPFAALRDSITAREPAYLIERHSLQIVPGAFLLGRQAAKEANGNDVREIQAPSTPSRQPGKIGYVGFGDAIYNAADPRFEQGPWHRSWLRPEIPGQLNRLVASSEEIERSARAWRESTGSSAGETLVFEGTTATREAFLNVVNTAAPAAIHLATHVLTGDTPGEQAFLAFSSLPGGSPGLVATSDVARLNVSGALVLMTGCSSGTGDIRAGAGILGLTRAWLIAGASGVVATGWAAEDVAGGLLPSFYRNLQKHGTAEALRRSQIDMLRSGSWQADPSYWASYQFTGVTR